MHHWRFCTAVVSRSTRHLYRERGLVERRHPQAIEFLEPRFSRGGGSGALGVAIYVRDYLASVVGSGPLAFIAYWIIALVAIVEALPLLRRSVVSAT